MNNCLNRDNPSMLGLVCLVSCWVKTEKKNQDLISDPPNLKFLISAVVTER